MQRRDPALSEACPKQSCPGEQYSRSTPKDRQERLHLSYLITIGCSITSKTQASYHPNYNCTHQLKNIGTWPRKLRDSKPQDLKHRQNKQQAKQTSPTNHPTSSLRPLPTLLHHALILTKPISPTKLHLTYPTQFRAATISAAPTTYTPQRPPPPLCPTATATRS